jgi:hypothetical protein
MCSHPQILVKDALAFYDAPNKRWTIEAKCARCRVCGVEVLIDARLWTEGCHILSTKDVKVDDSFMCHFKLPKSIRHNMARVKGAMQATEQIIGETNGKQL